MFRKTITARNFLLEERSRKPEIGGLHGGERGLHSVFNIASRCEDSIVDASRYEVLGYDPKEQTEEMLEGFLS